MQVIKSLDPLLENKAFMGFEMEDKLASGLGFGAEAGSAFLAENMKAYENLKFLNADGIYNRTPAPEYSTEVAKRHGLTNDTGTIQTVLDLTCYPREYFAPKDYFTGRLQVTKNTYSIHHYDSTWFTPEEQVQRKHDLVVAKLRYISYIPRSVAERLLGTPRYKKMVASVKGLFTKGKK